MPTGIYPRTKEQYKKIGLAVSIANKGKTPWNKGKKLTEKDRKSYQKYWNSLKEKIGKRNSFFGKVHSEEFKEKISKKFKGKHHSIQTEFKKGILHLNQRVKFDEQKAIELYKNGNSIKDVSTQLGFKNVSTRIANLIKNLKLSRHKRTIKTKEKMSKSRIEWMKNNIIFKPTQPEKICINLINQLNIPYKYTGDGKFWLENRNPDFVNYNGQKKIIEVYGDYWHNRPDQIEKDKKTLEIYSKHGYNTLIIWEKEFKNINEVKNVLINFERGSPDAI